MSTTEGTTMTQEYIAMRTGHIQKTQDVSGLVGAWSDLFVYLGEAMSKPRWECPYCSKLVADDDDFYECGSEDHHWREHVECSDEAESAR